MYKSKKDFISKLNIHYKNQQVIGDYEYSRLDYTERLNFEAIIQESSYSPTTSSSDSSDWNISSFFDSRSDSSSSDSSSTDFGGGSFGGGGASGDW